MSMIGYFLAIKPERGEELAHDPASVSAFVDEAIQLLDACLNRFQRFRGFSAEQTLLLGLLCLQSFKLNF